MPEAAGQAASFANHGERMAFAPMFWVAKNLAITGAGPLRDPYQIGSHEAAVADQRDIRTAKSDPRERHFVQANAGSANRSGSTVLQTTYQEAAVVRPRRLKFMTAGLPLVFQADQQI